MGPAAEQLAPQADRAPPAGVSDVPTRVLPTPAHGAGARAPRSRPPQLGPGCR